MKRSKTKRSQLKKGQIPKRSALKKIKKIKNVQFSVQFKINILTQHRRRIFVAEKQEAEKRGWKSVMRLTYGTNTRLCLMVRQEQTTPSEGWHNRFQMVVGRRHRSLYAFLAELQHEQGDTESILHQIDLGQAVREMPKGKLQEVEDRISNIVRRYDEYVEEDNVLN